MQNAVTAAPPVEEAASFQQVAPATPLRHSFAWTLAGNLVYMGCQGGMLMCLAKLGSPEMVGQFALGLAVAGPVMVLANLQLRNVQATDARSEYEFPTYFGLRMITTSLAMAVIAVLVSAGHYTAQTTWVILLMGAAKGVESVSDVFYGLLQRHERMSYIAISLMLKGGLSLPALAAGVILGGSVAWGVAGMLAAWTCVLALYDVPVISRLGLGSPRLRWEPAVFRRLTVLSLPLGIVMMLLSLNANIPRYVIERFHGARELGIYAALAYVPVAANAVINALGQSISPRMSVYYAAGQAREFRRLLGLLLLAGLGMGLAIVAVAAFAGDPLLELLFEKRYAGQGSAFLILMAGAAVGFVGSFLGYGVTAARYFRIQLPIMLCVAVTTLAACWVWVPGSGATGAAWAVLLAFVVQLVLTGAVMWHAVRKLGRGREVAHG